VTGGGAQAAVQDTPAFAIPGHVDPACLVDIDIYALPGQEADFHASWLALMDRAPPLVWTPRNEGHWIALRGDVLAQVQADHTCFSSRVIVIPKSVGELHGLIPTTIDPPAHRPYRKLLNEGLALGRMRQLAPRIAAEAGALIDGFAAQGRCDFTAAYAEVFPIRIFMALVGLPMAEAENIRLWAASMTRPNPPMPFEQARAAFFDYLGPILASRRVAPGEDLLSHLVNSNLADGDEPRVLAHDEALSLATQVLIAGVDTVVNMLGFVLKFLAENPQARDELATASPPQVLAATNELFRRFGLVTIGRIVREDTLFHGATLKAGEMICVPTQIHGLDRTINTDPLTVDFARRSGRHSAFGSGPHMCPGQELARIEVALTITEWLRRIPQFRLAEDADTRCSGGIVGQINRLVLEWDV
jgi:cytochrome P450